MDEMRVLVVSITNVNENIIAMGIDVSTGEGVSELHNKINELVVCDGWEHDSKRSTLSINAMVEGEEAELTFDYSVLSVFGDVVR